jgi:hypothetical protein
VTVAATTLESLQREAEKGCVTCGIFAPAIKVLISEESKTKSEAKDTEDVEETRVNFEFQMSYLGDSLNVSVVPLGLRISFFATECQFPASFVFLPSVYGWSLTQPRHNMVTRYTAGSPPRTVHPD